MSKISLQIGAKDFDIKLDGDFSEFFEEDFRKTFEEKSNVDVKELLLAYVQKVYNEYENEKQIKEILLKLAEIEEA